MRAIATTQPLPVTHPEALIDVELPEPTPGPRDLLVEVRAIAVNPVDYKVRASATPPPGQPKVLGWDAAGVVRAIGAEVTRFAPGDRVWYAGSIARPGANSERHVVDERIVGPMPVSLDFAAAAALPLTALTAWELLFDRLGVAPGTTPSGQSLLIVGAAGGVGSILTQLARTLTGLTVIGTASRPETQAWVRARGAHHVIDHARPIGEQLAALGLPHVTHVASLTHTSQHAPALIDALVPQGKFGVIDEAKGLEIGAFQRKSLSVHYELMFTRSLFETPDMIEQQRILTRVAALVDDGTVTSTVGEHLGRIDAANVRRAHALLESGRTRGKLVLEGF